MEKITVKKSGYEFLVKTTWISLLLIGMCVISLIINSDSRFKILDNSETWGVIICVILFYMGIYFIYDIYVRNRIEKNIKRLIGANNKRTFNILRGDKIRDGLYYDEITGKMGKVLSFRKSEANLAIFNIKEIKSIEKYVRKEKDYEDKVSKKEPNKYAKAGGLLGGIGGIMGGAIIDSITEKKRYKYINLGLDIYLTEGEHYQCKHGDYELEGDDNLYEILGKRIDKIENFINKIKKDIHTVK